ncbi:MAG: Hpt domain-containing protein [Granulosicoccus sp.]
MTSTIDHHALRVISSEQRPGKPDLLARVIHVFKTESPKAIAAMQVGLDSSDLAAVRNAAHTLKSSSAYVGAKVFSELCEKLESAACENNYTACVDMACQLEDLLEACCLELDVYMSTMAA